MTNALLVTTACLALGALVTSGSWRAQRALTIYLVLVVAINLWQVSALGDLTPVVFVFQEIAAMLLRYMVVVEALAGVFAPLPGARRVVGSVVLVGCVATSALLAWGLALPSGPRATFRELALANASAGLLLLILRAFTLRYYLPVPPLQRMTMTWFGAYLVLRGMLLGAATEWSADLRSHAMVLSSAAWCGWALALAWAAWVGPHWHRPRGVPS